MQIESFYKLLRLIKEKGIAIPKIHIQSSYGFLNYPELKCNYVRTGVALYISRVQISENLGENYRFSGENSRKNPKGAEKRKSLQTAKTACRLSFLAEWVGFEPTVPEGTTDFESVPL